MSQATNTRIFISYSHRGNGPKWKAALLAALRVFEQHHLLDVWEDGRICVSSFWDGNITQAMANARIAVVLLTEEALQSQYILERELPFLLDRQQRDKLPVFPVICEPCDWKAHDWLRATQAPNSSSPLSELADADIARVFRQLATDIAEQISQIALAELARPAQPPVPDRIYLDRFPLASTATEPLKLIGREQESALLDLAFAQPQTAVLSLVAWGGVGKTVLVQNWLNSLQRVNWFDARCVYAWSFYSQGTREDRQASEDAFLVHALEWFGVQCDPATSPWDKGRLLADAVARERTLLILDGVEPLQYPPGPMGGQLRAPGVQTLLRRLATTGEGPEHRSLCIVTTREPVADLADYERGPTARRGRAVRVDLGNLTEDAGAALLHHAGARCAGAADIPPDHAELRAASRKVDGHALTLHLLGRFLHRAHLGDIRRRDLVEFNQADSTVQGGHTFRMLAAFEEWFAKGGEFGGRRLAVLRLLGLFDRPADAGCIAALRCPPFIAGLTDALFVLGPNAASGSTSARPLVEEDWSETVSFLAEFGLLAIQTGQSAANNHEYSLDCHPLIREYFAKRLRERNSEAWRTAHNRLYEHLKAASDYQPDTLEGLQPLYQAVAHGCQAGIHQEACMEILWTRIRRSGTAFSLKKLGAIGADLGAMASFLQPPWSRPAQRLSADLQAWVLVEAAFCLRALGRLTEALEPMQAGLERFSQQEDWWNAAGTAYNLSELALILGEVPFSVCQAKDSVIFADRSGERYIREDTRAALADALHQAGKQADALACFREAETLQKQEALTPWLYSLRGFRYCDLLLAEPASTAWQVQLGRAHVVRRTCDEVRQRAAETLRCAEQQGLPFDIALDHLTLGRAALYSVILGQCRTDIPSAEFYLAAAVDGLRRAGRHDYLLRALLSRAWLLLLKGDAYGARADLDEAWQITECGPMRLHMADIHLYRACLFHAVKPYPWNNDKHGQPRGPKDDLAAAQALIEQCGYWRRKGELEDAEEAAKGW